MKLLPCLRWSRSRWWLPLDATTAEALASVLLGTSGGSGAAAESGAERRRHIETIQSRLHSDPSFLIFAVLRRAEQDRRKPQHRNPPDAISTARLAPWLLKRLPQLLAQPDRQLSAPAITAAERDAWQELAARCRNLPCEDWLSTAPQWLRITGEAPSMRWQATWPRLRCPQRDSAEAARADAEPPLRYALGAMELSRLAAVVRSERQLRCGFDQRLQTEKLASLKQFAYGLTHEINNPLANIVTRSEQLQAGESDPKRVDSLQKIVGQAMRAHEMISDVMFFAHPPIPETAAVDLTALVNRVVAEYAQRCEQQGIELNGVDAQPLECTADAAMLHDAVDSLLRNAVEAIGSGGRIVVRRGRRGNKVWVSVADSGPGLSEVDRRHAFDPFYSGREAGRGLGLGLCRVYRIAQLHRGGASLSSGVAGCVARIWIAK